MCLGVFVCMCVYFQEKDNIRVYVRKGMWVVFNFFQFYDLYRILCCKVYTEMRIRCYRYEFLNHVCDLFCSELNTQVC